MSEIPCGTLLKRQLEPDYHRIEAVATFKTRL